MRIFAEICDFWKNSSFFDKTPHLLPKFLIFRQNTNFFAKSTNACKILSIPQRLDIRLKWPNDIYVNGSTKIGGLVVNTEITGTTAICNVGIGFNLNNSVPTTCINDMITSFNMKNNTNLPYLEYECFFANVSNEIERLLDIVQDGDFQYLYDLYYKLWLHSNAEIVIIDADGNKKLATIIGIDDYGYLLVKQPNHEPESVHPDGNTFDILRGLISAKHY